MKIYGVKSCYRWQVVGRKISNIEERILVFKARNFDEAIRKAQKESKEYAKEIFINPYGQKVKIKVLKYFDAYELSDDLKSGCEVFSTTIFIKSNLTDKAIVRKMVDLDLSYTKKEEKKLSTYFRNIKFSGPLREMKSS